MALPASLATSWGTSLSLRNEPIILKIETSSNAWHLFYITDDRSLEFASFHTTSNDVEEMWFSVKCNGKIKVEPRPDIVDSSWKKKSPFVVSDFKCEWR